MSLIPDRHICPECGGYDMTGMGQFCRSLSSRCKCDELTEQVERELKRTMELQRKRA